MANAEQHMDHLGHTWPSLRAMCASYGISPTTYLSRQNLGWTVDKCLTSNPSERTVCSAWPERQYASMRDLAKAMDVPYNAVFRQLTYFGKDGRDAIEPLCHKYWPGKIKNGYKVISCVQFPWFLCAEGKNPDQRLVINADELLLKIQ